MTDQSEVRTRMMRIRMMMRMRIGRVEPREGRRRKPVGLIYLSHMPEERAR